MVERPSDTVCHWFESYLSQLFFFKYTSTCLSGVVPLPCLSLTELACNMYCTCVCGIVAVAARIAFSVQAPALSLAMNPVYYRLNKRLYCSPMLFIACALLLLIASHLLLIHY